MNELTVLAEDKNVVQVTEFIENIIEGNDGSIKAKMQIDVAVDEIFSNIAFYAYQDMPELGDVTIRVQVDDNKLISIDFIDKGIPFNPLERDDPDVTLSIDERQIGGLGIFIAKKTMNSISYKRENDCNILTIKKQL